jgi:hypothetical protein
MRERAHGLRFLGEPLPRALIAQEVLVQQLDGDRSVELLVMGAPDLGGTAHGQARLEAISAENEVVVPAA